jgi:hypothetical protein
MAQTPAVIELGDGQVRTRPGLTADPDLTLDGPPRAVLGLLTGQIGLERAEQLGLSAAAGATCSPACDQQRRTGRVGVNHWTQR